MQGHTGFRVISAIRKCKQNRGASLSFWGEGRRRGCFYTQLLSAYGRTPAGRHPLCLRCPPEADRPTVDIRSISPKGGDAPRAVLKFIALLTHYSVWPQMQSSECRIQNWGHAYFLFLCAELLEAINSLGVILNPQCTIGWRISK